MSANQGKDSKETPASKEQIVDMLKELLKTLGATQFSFVITYVFNKDFRRLVYEEKKLKDRISADVIQGEIDESHGDAESAKIIWGMLGTERGEQLSHLSKQYMETIDVPARPAQTRV